ncbi:hypothetical protein GGR53DRAFT_524443 [Hypoxylon sp. FL1150]|nr:hypothetical protein GGR53DRAFT_524443 [Hypoxylon sp. FL1150]
MTFLATILGLCIASRGSSTPSYAPAYLNFHFVFAYCALDHQPSPPAKPAMIAQKQLNVLKRNEGAHANSVGNYTLLIGAMGFATFAPEIVNRAGLLYTTARIAYGISYISIEDSLSTVSRGIFGRLGMEAASVIEARFFLYTR